MRILRPIQGFVTQRPTIALVSPFHCILLSCKYSSDKSTVCSGTKYSTHTSHAQDMEAGREKPEHSSSNCKKGFQPTLANSL